MSQSDRTELVLVFIALLVAIVFDLAMGIGDRFDVDRFVVVLTPNLGVLFGADVVTGTVSAAFFGGLAIGAKLLFDSRLPPERDPRAPAARRRRELKRELRPGRRRGESFP